MPGTEKLDEAADLLAKAKMPLIIAGGGVHISGASRALAQLQETARLPVLTTVMGKGAVDESHPLSLGVAGYALGRLSPARHMRNLIGEADVILLVGTRTNQNGTDSWTAYPQKAKYIHIDVDASEIGRNYEALRLLGDARETLTALTQRLAGRRPAIPDFQRAVATARRRHQEDCGLWSVESISHTPRTLDGGHPECIDQGDDRRGGCQLFHALGGMLLAKP